MDRSRPYAVKGKISLVVMNATDGLPVAFALMGTRAHRKVAIRITGGCKGMSAEDKEQMLDYFNSAFAGFRGLIWSGATRQVNNGVIDPMVTDIPGIIAANNSGCVALGTVPRTDMMSLQEDSRLVLDEWGTAPNPDMSGILIVQNGPDGKMDWDGDLDTYFAMMQNWRTYGGFTALGLCSWNGGEITRNEIMRAIRLKWPVILVKGSGRVTDEIIDLLDDKEFLKTADEDRIYVADRNQPLDLRRVLVKQGFISL